MRAADCAQRNWPPFGAVTQLKQRLRMFVAWGGGILVAPHVRADAPATGALSRYRPMSREQAIDATSSVDRLMRLLIATDAWHPQVNGVVRTLGSLAKSLRRQGVAVDFLTPEGFASLPVPTYPGLRVALPNPAGIARRIEEVRAKRHSHRYRRADRAARAALLHQARTAVHDELHHAFPRIHQGALSDPRALVVLGPAALPRRCRGDHGRPPIR